jgi:hypothetical protein
MELLNWVKNCPGCQLPWLDQIVVDHMYVQNGYELLDKVITDQPCTSCPLLAKCITVNV